MTTRRQLLHSFAAAGALGLPAILREARAQQAGRQHDRFELGVASGHPAPDGMVLWTRLTGPDLPSSVAVTWEVAHDESFRRIAARGVERADAEWAHSVHAEPAGLEPGRWYWYRFRALGMRSATGRTRTAPAPGDRTTLEFAIASCQRFDHGHYAAWRDAAAQELDLVLFLGDYIYEYPFVPGRVRAHRGGMLKTLADYRDRYAQYRSDPHLQAAHAAAPWLMVWDDHEVDNDYAGLQGADLQPDFAVQREAAYRAYWEHMPFPKSARPRGPDMRIVSRLDWGSLARVHLLDDRQYRDPQACPRPLRGGSNTVSARACPALFDPKRSLLGPEQERWLAAGWDTERPWNLVAQQTLMARFTWTGGDDGPAYWTDGWSGYPAARERLLAGVAERKLPGVVVLGGDVHANYVADLKLDFDDPRAPAVATEFCGTSIASRSANQARIDAARAFNPHVLHGRADQRGYVRFSLDARALQATLRVVDDVDDPSSPVRTQARFTVEAGRPGAKPS
jgi:alkaline phosphatase D